MTSIPAVQVDGLDKTFRLPQERIHTLKERALHPLRRTRYQQLTALRGVSFSVDQGEFFGIVGRNGSGKSTLLKLIAGIYGADSGTIRLRGRMSPFIELGVGFNPELPARDNVLLNAIMLGLTPDEAEARFGSIIEFAELEEFVDLKLKNYSAGMHVRLAFAVMAKVDADVLLIDEVLAVGDAAFQQKCFDTLEERRRAGTTILFVSHAMDVVEMVCDRAMLLEGGRVVEIGQPAGVARRYNEINFATARAAAMPDWGGGAGDGDAKILDAWFENADGRRVPAMLQGEACSFHALVEFVRSVERPALGFVLADERKRRVFAANTQTARIETGAFAAGERVELSVHFKNVLAAGRYFASPVVAHSGPGAKVMDLRGEMVTFVVTGGHAADGLVALPHEVRLQRIAETERVG